jgi:hypothetical protein
MSTNNFASYGKWGPGVIGKEEYERQQAVLKSGAHKWGPGVIDPVGVAKPVNKLAETEQPKKGKRN